MTIEALFETPDTTHYEFRAGHWWRCVQGQCDGKHHYYLAAPEHV